MTSRVEPAVSDTGGPVAAAQTRAVLLDGWDAALAVAVGVAALVLYRLSVTPGLLAGDGGELQTLTYLLGNTHPTGYPVWLALSRLFALLPLGEMAYRVNLFSAVMGAAAVGGLYLCGRVLTGRRATSWAAALALAVVPAFWSQALIAEVYTAGAAFIVFILLALLVWDATAASPLANRTLFVAGLLGGLSLGVHMSVALLAPAVVLFLALHRRRGRGMWLAAGGGALLGVVLVVGLFAALEWRDSPAGYFNSVIEPSRSAWGLAAEEIDGPLERLWYGWQARQFRYLMFADPGAVMPRQAADYAAGLRDEMGLILIVLAIIGAVALVLKRPKVAALLLVALATQLVVFFNYEIWDLYVFYIPSYVILGLLASAGLGALAALVEGAVSRWRPGKATGAAVDVVLAALLLGLVVWPAIRPHREALAAGEIPFTYDDYPVYEENLLAVAAATVAALPQDALVLTDWDMMWPYYYAAHVVGDRPDLLFLETIPADDQDEPADSLLAAIDDTLDGRPVLAEERWDALARRGLNLSPQRMGPTMMFVVSRAE